MILPVILSGGAGSRLWPLSHSAAPKQLLALVTERTMVQDTAARFAGDAFLAPAFICNAAHADSIDAQVPGDGMLILEPVGRNTAPCAAVAALHGEAVGAELVLLSPADHHVTRPEAFREAVMRAVPAAMGYHLVTFGITPTGPETGYGYIRAGHAIDPHVSAVEAFVEKPDLATAQGYLEEGGYSWNAGLFLFRPDAMLVEMRAHCPAILDAARAAYAGAVRGGRTLALDGEAFAACPSDSVDYAVMEPTSRAAVIPVDMGWSDIGSFSALHGVRERDTHNTAAPEGTTAIDSRGCLVVSDGPAVSLVGMEGVGVIIRDGEVLVVDLDRAQEVKRVVDALKAAERTDRL